MQRRPTTTTPPATVSAIERVGEAWAKAAHATELAERELGELQAEHDSACEAQTRAERAYVDEPNDERAAEVSRTSGAARLVSLRLNAAKDKAHAARKAERDARDALDNAEKEAKLASDRAEASLDAFKARIAPHAEQLADALRAVREHAQAIDVAFNEANAAAARAGMPALDRAHQVLPLLAALGIVPNDESLNTVRGFLTPSMGYAGPAHPGGLARLLLQGLEAIEKLPRAAGDERLAELAIVGACRTEFESRERIHARREEAVRAERERLANSPEQRQLEWTLEQQRLRGEGDDGVPSFEPLVIPARYFDGG